jgi:hypothetical protein
MKSPDRRSPKRKYRRFTTETEHPGRVVRLEENRIVFDEKVNAMAHRHFMRIMHSAQAHGYEDLVLDFAKSHRVYPDGMIPIICTTAVLRRQGISIQVILPWDASAASYFLSNNWAHHLAPDLYTPTDFVGERHLATQRFANLQEQQTVVNQIMDVVMGTMDLDREILDGLEWSVSEVTDNVLNHAQAIDGGFVQVTTHRETGTLGFVVGDAGRGVLASMREGYPHLVSDKIAIGEAMKAGVTRNPEAGQGNGLAGTLRIATLSGGGIAITSGLSQVLVAADMSGSHESRSFDRRPIQHYQGTLVAATIKRGAKFSMADALAFPGIPYSRFDIIDSKYGAEDGGVMRMQLSTETTGFGSRGSGRQIRTKCLNILNADSAKPLILDWDGVPLISSSFADEVVGKLFVELGPTGYMSRIRNVGMEKLVRILVDKAIMQRTAQAAAGGPTFDLGSDNDSL